MRCCDAFGWLDGWREWMVRGAWMEACGLDAMDLRWISVGMMGGTHSRGMHRQTISDACMALGRANGNGLGRESGEMRCVSLEVHTCDARALLIVTVWFEGPVTYNRYITVTQVSPAPRLTRWRTESRPRRRSSRAVS